MTVSVLLRVTRLALTRGVLAGEVEIVESGERGTVTSAEELLAFVRAHAPRDPDPPVSAQSSRSGRSRS